MIVFSHVVGILLKIYILKGFVLSMWQGLCRDYIRLGATRVERRSKLVMIHLWSVSMVEDLIYFLLYNILPLRH